MYATARRLDSIADLKGCEKLQLDVTVEASMVTAIETIQNRHGSLGALVNNAGYGIHGAFETTRMESVRAQFETNFFGLVRLTQLVLPGMRRAGRGRIVNVSSMGGRLTLPGGAFYHASKHAVEAATDALRYEVAPFGIKVVLIEPGLIRTSFGETAIATVGHSSEVDEAYAEFNSGLVDRIQSAYHGAMRRFASSPPSTVARAIDRALTSSRPRTRYVVTPGAKALLAVHALLPDRAFDAVLRTQYPEPRAKR